MLVKTTAHGLAETRSMKYLQGCAKGCWVVSDAWADACMQAGRWVEEKAFEVKASAAAERAGGRARLL